MAVRGLCIGNRAGRASYPSPRVVPQPSAVGEAMGRGPGEVLAVAVEGVGGLGRHRRFRPRRRLAWGDDTDPPLPFPWVPWAGGGGGGGGRWEEDHLRPAVDREEDRRDWVAWAVDPVRPSPGLPWDAGEAAAEADSSGG
jgi:hypothetical protein